MSAEKLTVEIFRDAATPDVSRAPAMQGVSYIDQIVGDVEIVRANRTVYLVPDDEPTLRSDKIDFPVREADIQLIVTNRDLMIRMSDEEIQNGSPEYMSYVGIAWSGMVGGVATRMALVTFQGDHSVDLTTAHEIGHLFRIEPKPNSYAGYAHCGQESCLMHHYNYGMSIVRRVPRHGFGKLLERSGLVLPETETLYTSCATSFCDHCSDQLEMRGYFMKKASAGEAVLPAVLGFY